MIVSIFSGGESMLKRKLLTRLTRLGLALYAMTWCMSFTVCAAENPIADLSVAGTVELMTEEETQEPADQEFAAPVESAADEEVTVVPEEAEEPEEPEADPVAEEPVLGAPINVSLTFAPESLTVTEPGIFNLTLAAEPADLDLSVAAVFVAVNEDAESADTISGVSAEYAEGEVALTVGASAEDSTIYVIAAVVTEDGTFRVACPVRIHMDVTELELIPPVIPINGTVIINDTSKSIKVGAVGSKPEGVTWNDDAFSWSILEDGQAVAANRGVTYAVVEGSNSMLNVSFAHLSSPGIFEVVAAYNNSFIGLDGDVVERDAVTESLFFDVNPYCYNVTSVEMGGYNSGEPVTAGANLTFVVKPGEPASALLDPDRIVWGLTNKNAGPNKLNLRDELHGIKIIGHGMEASLITGGAVSNVDVDVVAKYYNEDPAPFINSTDTDAEYVYNTVSVSVEATPDNTEAHLPVQTMKMNVYKKENTLPVVIRKESGKPVNFNV